MVLLRHGYGLTYAEAVALAAELELPGRIIGFIEGES